MIKRNRKGGQLNGIKSKVSRSIATKSLLATALVLTNLFSLHAQSKLVLTGGWPGFVWGTVTAVTADGNRGYAAVEEGYESFALVIFDVSDPTRPLRLGSYPTLDPPADIFPVSNLVYMVNRRSSGYGVDVLDVSKPSFPFLLGRYDTPESNDDFSMRVRVRDGYAFITLPLESGESPGVLEIVDVSNPASPVRVARHALRGSPSGLDVQGNYVFVAQMADWSRSNDFGGLEIIDVSNKAIPVKVGAYDITETLGGATDVQVVGNYAYLVAWDLEAVDVSTPTNPVRAGGYPAPCWTRIHVAGGYAYLSRSHCEPGYKILDVSNPAAPTFAANINIDVRGYDIHVVGDHAYLTDGDAGLRILDVSNPYQPLPGNSHEPLSVGEVYVTDGYAYADTENGLAILDLSNPIQPRRAGNYPGGWMSQVVGNRGYVISDGWSGDRYTNAFDIVDMSNPTNLVRLGRYDTDLEMNRLQVIGNRVYLTQLSSTSTNLFGLEVVDVENPANPTRLSRFMTNAVMLDVLVKGSHAFVADGSNDLRVLDIGDAANPVVVGTYNTNAPPDVEISWPGGSYALAQVGQYVYTAGAEGYLVMDVSDPTAPFSVATVFTPIPIFAIRASGRYAGLPLIWPGGSEVSYSFLVLDVGDPHDHSPVGEVSPGYFASRFTFDHNFLYLPANDGLLIYEIQPPRSIRISRVAGNNLLLEWNGALGLFLETASSPEAEWWMWTEVSGSDGSSSVIVPIKAGQQFFRLFQP